MGKKKVREKEKKREREDKKPEKPELPKSSDPHTGEGVRELFGTCDPDDKHFT